VKILMTVLREAPFSIKLRARYHVPAPAPVLFDGLLLGNQVDHDYAARGPPFTSPPGSRSRRGVGHDKGAAEVLRARRRAYCGRENLHRWCTLVHSGRRILRRNWAWCACRD
jgi:hypothetical protein